MNKQSAAPAISAPTVSAEGATPAMAQYIELKHAFPDSLLFYQMGDFYELFFNDAITAAATLGLTLTKRGKHAGQDIPMCGVPLDAANTYWGRLAKAGHKVTVCEQVENPAEAKKRGAKAVVRRAVVRHVTPGTITEDTLLEATANSYLAAVSRDGGDNAGYALAWCDLSTGEFSVRSVSGTDLGGEIARIAPQEILLAESARDDETLNLALSPSDAVRTVLSNPSFDSVTAPDRMKTYFEVATLKGLTDLSRAEGAVCAAIILYLERTQIGRKAPISPPRRIAGGQAMVIDAATRANLEIAKTMAGETRGSLIACIDRTVTAPGHRKLAADLTGPLTDVIQITRRHEAVSLLADKTSLRDKARDALKHVPDIARALSRTGLERGGPRDLGAIRDGLRAARALGDILNGADIAESPALVALADAFSTADQALESTLSGALIDEPPLSRRDGGFVRAGHKADLDDLRALRDESRQVIAAMQGDHAQTTGVKSLKIKHNNVLGYFIEVTAQNAQPLFDGADYIHRQTLANAVRFTTVELGELESKIVSAGDKALAIEQVVFNDLAKAVLNKADHLKALADALARFDVFAAHAALARERDYARPIVDGTLAFEVTGGRHPVVEAALERDDSGPFVVNDCALSPPADHDAGQLWILTGPNMGGKSTFLRQNAIIAMMAQAGAFVPAASAHIGIVDRLFSRVGAADDLARGRSTFMVEMVEAAAILNQAGPRGLVILDEIGRGTATFDGLSIAWAAVEHLHDVNKCRALFATHFHELTVLAGRLDRVFNATVKVKEWQGDVVFLHEVAAGAADRSYGVQVAKLAGLPGPVIERARAVLDRLEAGERQGGAKAVIDDLPLFSVKQAPRAESDPLLARLKDTISSLQPDHMSPREALDALYALKALLAGQDR